MAKLQDVIQRGTNAARPAATAVPVGTLYYDTTNSSLARSSGTAWESVEAPSGLADQGTITYLDGTVAAAPGTPAAGKLRVYAKTGKVLAVKDDAGLETVFGTGIADQGAFTYLDATEAAAPGTPAAGKARIYAKADGRIYSKDDAGVESGPFSSGGGAADPLLYVDDIALHADGDTFGDTALPGWTKVGTGTATLVTTELYDAAVLDLQFSAVSDRIYKAVDAGDWTYYLTVHGVTNATPSSNTALGAMMALTATDDSGNGTGVSLYSDGQGYVWTVASNAHSASTAITQLSGWNSVLPPTATNFPVVYRLAKVGTTLTGGISFNGGASWATNNRTDATTFTRIGITRIFTSGDTNPTLRIGRFDLVP